MKLNTLAFGLASGIWWGVGVFLLTWWLIVVGAGTTESGLLEALYIGYSISPLGSVVGLAWGFVCGAICGGILAWLYNVLSEKVGSAEQTMVRKAT